MQVKENSHYKAMLSTIKNLSYTNGDDIFTDFLEMSAISISNTVDPIHREEREARYLTIIKKYPPDKQQLFPELFANLVGAMESAARADELNDVLGVLFHDLELHNKYKGQFFTPQHICNMMGLMAIGEHDKAITEKGYITMGEPCAGSGAIVIGFAQAMKKEGYNYSKQLVVTATDIDPKCVWMCYLQLSLYGIPAVVVHGNTITLEEWSHWFTPVYIIDGWHRRKRPETDSPEPEKPITQSEQLSLFDTL